MGVPYTDLEQSPFVDFLREEYLCMPHNNGITERQFNDVNVIDRVGYVGGGRCRC